MEIMIDGLFNNPLLPINRDWDTFSRPDTTGDTAGVTEGAKLPWQVLAPNPAEWATGVRSNQLSVWRKSLPDAAERALAVVDTGKADGVYGFRLRAVAGGSQGGRGNFVFRVRDRLNYLWVYANDTDKVWSLYRVVNGSSTRLALGTVTAGYTALRVELDGPQIRVLAGGVETATATYSNFLDATKHGVAVLAGSTDTMTSSRFDDFSFTDL